MLEQRPQNIEANTEFDSFTNVLESTGGIRFRRMEGVYELRREMMYNRSLTAYEGLINQDLGPDGPDFDIHDWKGKRLLDIGSGGYESFSMDARLEGVQVFSVNPSLIEERHRHILKKANHWRADEKIKRSFAQKAMRILRENTSDAMPGDLTAAAIGQQLPFREGSFDGVVSVFAVPHYLYQTEATFSDEQKIERYTPEVRKASVEEIKKAIKEIVRVLKPGGQAFLVDTHMKAGQETNILGPFAADGSELKEVLEQIEGITFNIYEIEENDAGELAMAEGVLRTTVITKQ